MNVAVVQTNPAFDVLENLSETERVAKAFQMSGMFPDLKSESQAVVKVIAGREMGLGPMAAISGLNVIQGKATPSANLLGTLVKRHPAYDYIPKEITSTAARIEFFQHGTALGISEFTIDDAATAGLNGVNWKKYPKAMLFARALSQGVRWFCPDVTAGSAAYVPEELGADVDEDGEMIQPPPTRQRPDTVDATEADAVEVLEPERVRTIAEKFGAFGLEVPHIIQLFETTGIEAPTSESKPAVMKRLTDLTPDEADRLETVLGEMADREADQ